MTLTASDVWRMCSYGTQNRNVSLKTGRAYFRRAYLKNHTLILNQTDDACWLWPSLGPSLAALRYGCVHEYGTQNKNVSLKTGRAYFRRAYLKKQMLKLGQIVEARCLWRLLSSAMRACSRVVQHAEEKCLVEDRVERLLDDRRLALLDLLAFAQQPDLHVRICSIKVYGYSSS